MKKTTLAVIVAGLAVATSASANWYVQGDLGVSKTKFTSFSEMNKTKVDTRVSGGYDLGDWRVAVDYTHHGKFKGNGNSAKIAGFGVSALYDIDLDAEVKPYVGARIATNGFKVNSQSAHFKNDTTYKFGYGAIVGAQYKVANNVALNGGVEYNRLGKFEDTNVNQYGVRAGVRYDF
ncbi:hypothetical protein A4G18_07275 [Pasteurellaceae bacterium Pebbles2]|nr:hypothetical protein [Pasteurellaceae bacterium Pebbles2]